MKALFSCSKRFVALALALLLMVPAMAMPAFAADPCDNIVTVGQLVADNYDALTAEEKALLESGLLAEESYGYNNMPDGAKLEINTETKTVTVPTYDAGNGDYWVISGVPALYDTSDALIEELSFVSEGKYHYEYDGNAFYVKANYVLETEVSVDDQMALLNAAGQLKNGLGYLKAAYDGADANLGTVVLAMDILSQLADGSISMGWFAPQFGEPAINAVENLEAQLAANGGQLDLQVWNAAYAAAGNKTQYLVENGDDYLAVVYSTYSDLLAISSDDLLNDDILDGYLQSVQPTDYTAWDALKGILNTTANALGEVVNAAFDAEGNLTWTAPDLAAGGDYGTLDTLVNALGELTDLGTLDIQESLPVAKGTVQGEASMFNVTVKFALSEADPTVDSTVEQLLRVGSDVTVTVTLVKGATRDEVLAAIEATGKEAEVLAGWTNYVAGCFIRTTTDLADDFTLTENKTYIITYEPEIYEVNTWGSSISKRYGATMSLPVHGDAAQAYDYYVDGVYYAQGSVITITGNTTITREAGKAYTEGSLYQITADNYFALNSKGYNILTSGALLNDVEVPVRYPDPDNDSDLVTLEGVNLTADPYSSSYKNLDWVPYSYTVVSGDDSTVYYFNGATTATITAGDYDRVDVTYRLTLSNLATDAENAYDLVFTLETEADTQKNTLDRLSAKYDVMGQLDKTKLGALNGVIGVTDLHTDPVKNEELKAYFSGVVGNIIANSVDTNNYLKIYNILGLYQAGGLSYYYNNYGTVINEINALSGYLSEMLADDDKVAALTTLCTAAGFPDYVDKIADLEETMAEVKAALTAPNAAIDLGSDNLHKLTDALEQTADVTGTYTGDPVLDSEPFTQDAPDRATFSFYVSAAGVKKSYSKTFMLTAVLSAGDIAEMKAGVDAAIAELNAALGDNKLNKYYTGSYDAAVLDALVGQTVSNVTQLDYSYSWTPNEYTVYVVDMAPQTITINDLEIELATPVDANLRYDYTVDGLVCRSDLYTGYTFTLEQIDRLFTDGTYTITRNVVDLTRENLEQFVAKVNAEMGKTAFALVEEAGDYTGITANISTEDMMGMVMGLTQGGYGYIGLGGSGFIYFNDETVKTEASLQTLVDAMLNNGALDNQTIIDLGNGQKVNLLNTTIDLGNNASDAVSYTFTVYMTDATGMAAPAAAALAQVQDYVDLAVAAEGGVMTMTFNLPSSVYELYLAGLLLSGEADVADINAVSEELAYEFMLAYIHALSSEGVTAQTIMNTTAMLGKNVDLTGEKGTYINKVLARMSGLRFTAGEGYTYEVEANNDQLTTLLSKFVSDPAKLNMATGLLKECQDGNNLVIKLKAAITNFENIPTYEAIVIDAAAVKAAGKTEKLGVWDCTTDLSATLVGKTGTTVIVLQKDITDDLVIGGTNNVLDLNGHKISGNITVANGSKLVIIDSHMDSDLVGGMIDGVINGTNVTLLAGYYDYDVSAFLKEGYEQNADGYVRNTLYTIDVDSNGNVTFNVDAAAILGDINPTKTMGKALGIELAADLLVNYYTSAALSMGTDMDIYSANINALLSVITDENGTGQLINQALACLNLDGLNAFINDLMGKMNAFDEMAVAVSNDAPIASYTMTTNSWQMELKRNTTENYLDVNIIPNTFDWLTDINIVVVGSDEQKAEVVELFTELGNIITSVVEVEITGIDYNGNFVVAGEGAGEVIINLQHNNDYAAILGIIIGNANVNKETFVNALNNYFANDDLTDLRAAVDSITFNQLVTALKKLDRSTTFETMVSNLNVDVNGSSVDELDKLYRNIMAAAGYALEYAGVNGGSQSMASLGGNAITAGLECGTYVADKYDVEKEGSYTFQGYTAEYAVSVSEAILILKVFDADMHNYSSEYTSNADYHWHVCIIPGCNDTTDKEGHDHVLTWNETHHHDECICGDVINEAEHSFEDGVYVNTDDTYHWQVCVGCDYTTTPVEHDHNTWDYDGANHWKVCVCGHESAHEPHNDSNGDNKCDICDHIICEHTYGTEWESDDTNHWHECTECGHRIDVAAHTLTWVNTDADNHWQSCECGHTTTPAAHVLTWDHDADNHWEKCECGYTTTPATHTDDSTDGDHDCDTCGREDAFDHAYGAEWESDGANHWHECECGEKSDIAAHTDANGDNKCDVCEHIICEHTYGTAWESDDTNHWHECTECGHKVDVTAHSDVETDEDHKCDVCDADFGAHDYDDEWKSDETGHWHECNCGDKADFAEHTDAANGDHKCDICDYVMSGHSYGTEWKYDETNHWHECACGEKSDVAAHTDANGDHKCDICDYAMSGHSFGTEWKYDETNHWHECACGEKSDVAAHTDADGDHKCDVCDYAVSEHDFGTEWKSDATKHWHECACGEKSDVAEHTNNDSDGRCDVCGQMLMPELPPVHYHFYSWNSNDEGHWVSCYCGDSGNLLPHDDQDSDNLCDVCGYEMKVEVEFGCDGGEDCPAIREFDDVNIDAWYHEYVCYVYNAGLMQGMGNGKFQPFTLTTRAMLVTTLYRLAGCPEVTGTTSFTDVAEGQWYYDAILWAEQNEIVYGVSADKFAPCSDLTREQSVAMFYRFAKYLGMDVENSGDLTEYVDEHKVSNWAENAMEWSIAVGLIQGRTGNELAPTDGTKRVELATILTRWCLEIAE